MNRPATTHPWRKPPDDRVAHQRSGRFAAYLASLPADERQRIVAAERAYVYRTEPSIEALQRVVDESMSDVNENEPASLRGFVS